MFIDSIQYTESSTDLVPTVNSQQSAILGAAGGALALVVTTAAVIVLVVLVVRRRQRQKYKGEKTNIELLHIK